MSETEDHKTNSLDDLKENLSKSAGGKAFIYSPPNYDQKTLISVVLSSIIQNYDKIKEFQVVSVPGESFRVDIDYHKAKPWEGKVDYE